MLIQKPNQVLPQKLLKEAAMHFYCLFGESRFSDIPTIMELEELNWLCKHMKMSEAANYVFQWIFVLNAIKGKLFYFSIVKEILRADPKLWGCTIFWTQNGPFTPNKNVLRKSINIFFSSPYWALSLCTKF